MKKRVAVAKNILNSIILIKKKTENETDDLCVFKIKGIRTAKRDFAGFCGQNMCSSHCLTAFWNTQS